MGLPMENDLLATTSGQIMETESKFGTRKNLLSLTFQSINILLINHDICHMNWWWVKEKRSSSRYLERQFIYPKKANSQLIR